MWRHGEWWNTTLLAASLPEPAVPSVQSTSALRANRELYRAFCQKPGSRVVWCRGGPITLLLIQDCYKSIKVPSALCPFQYNTLLSEVSKKKKKRKEERKCLKRSCLIEKLRVWCLEKWYGFAGKSIKSSLDFFLIYSTASFRSWSKRKFHGT